MLLPRDILRITAADVYIWGGGGIYLQHRSFFTRLSRLHSASVLLFLTICPFTPRCLYLHRDYNSALEYALSSNRV